MELKNRHIFLLSTEFWGSHYLSKHHYALALKELGNWVYFIQPGKKKGAFSAGESPEGIPLIDFKPSIGQRHLPKSISRQIQKREWQKIIGIAGNSPDLIWSFDNSRLFHLDALPGVKSIHHLVDLNQDFELATAAKSANLCLGSTSFIVDELKKHQSESHFLHHGCVAKPCAPKVAGERLQLAYLGNVLLRFIDRSFVLSMIGEFPEVDFHFVGGYTQNNLIHTIDAGDQEYLEQLQSFPNTILHGAVPQDQLQDTFEQMDAFFIAYAKEHYAQAANPHKVMELISSGKPIISFTIDAFKSEQLLHFAEDPHQFYKLIHQLKNGQLENRRKQQLAFAEEHTYPAQIQKVASWISHW